MSNKQATSTKTVDLLAALGLFTFSLFISASIVSGEFLSRQTSVAEEEVSQLAMQLILSETIKQTHLLGDSRQRVPASIGSNRGDAAFKNPFGALGDEGVIGRDEWGNSFNFKVLRDSSKKPKKMVVWSRGENGVFDTDPANVTWKNSLSGDINFSGDDFGTVKSIDRYSKR